MRILGISAFYHDSAAALVEDGRIVGRRAGGALHPQEARLALPAPRDRVLPRARAGSGSATSTTSRSTTSRSSSSSGCSRPTSRSRRAASSSFRMAMPLWLKEKLFQKSPAAGRARDARRRTSTRRRSLLFAEHHQCHAASAFFPSPFEEAAVLTMDGVGEWATTSVGLRRGQPARDAQGDPLPALARAALLRLHLLHRLQGQLGRVQGHGPGALRRAAATRRRSSTT